MLRISFSRCFLTLVAMLLLAACGSSGSSPTQAIPASSEVLATDLISLHYDNAPDKDDGQAISAGRVISDVFGITPHVVVGTYGVNRRGDYVPGFDAVVDKTFPGARNAYLDWAAAVSATAARWQQVIAAGGRVWVAEGGPSDFTADVIDALPAGSDYSRIVVVQHSTWNEDETAPGRLNLVRTVTDYRKIADGNNGGNGTPDFRAVNDSFWSRALASNWSEQWAASQNFYPEVIDFSDAVEYLHILGVDDIADHTDFADRYF